jgi:transposase
VIALEPRIASLAERIDHQVPQTRLLQPGASGGSRRLLALAVIYGGGSRTEAAEFVSVTLQVVRDWVLRLNEHGPDGLIDRKAPGQPSRLNDEHRAALRTMVENGPISAVQGMVRWRIIDLCQWLWEEYEVTVSKQTLSRELLAMDYRKLSARPRHYAQTAGAVEARIGQKNVAPGRGLSRASFYGMARPPPRQHRLSGQSEGKELDRCRSRFSGSTWARTAAASRVWTAMGGDQTTPDAAVEHCGLYGEAACLHRGDGGVLWCTPILGVCWPTKGTMYV